MKAYHFFIPVIDSRDGGNWRPGLVRADSTCRGCRGGEWEENTSIVSSPCSDIFLLLNTLVGFAGLEPRPVQCFLFPGVDSSQRKCFIEFIIREKCVSIKIYIDTFGDQVLPAEHTLKRFISNPDHGVLVEGFARVGRDIRVLSPLQVRLQDPERKPVQGLHVSVLQL